MTKLEIKLIVLGYAKDYERSYENETYYLKHYKDFLTLHINVEVDGYITHSYVESSRCVACQQDIDILQQAFNQLQKDLEVLKEYEA